MLISNIAFAEDKILLGSVPARETKLRHFELNKGKFKIEVLPADSMAELSCAFSNSVGDLDVAQAEHKCLANVVMNYRGEVGVKISNKDNKELDYKITVTSVKEK